MCLFLENVLVLELSAYLCLFFTTFVSIFSKIYQKRYYYEVSTLCSKKRDCFELQIELKPFFLFSLIRCVYHSESKQDKKYSLREKTKY